MKNVLTVFFSLIILTSCHLNNTVVLIEAESFKDLGGWVIDQQFMDQMGSPFLLAHGVGIPVDDATTTINFPQSGKYMIWVRTRDWVATWNAPGAPGKFKLGINYEPLETAFGIEGKDWHWQQGGVTLIKKGDNKVSINDLTGFEGRCDAIIFTTDMDYIPPDSGKKLEELRIELSGISQEIKNAGTYDLVVIGGGIAGICAAISSARLGVKVALVQDRPVLGGNNSSEIRVWAKGGTNYEPYPHIGDLVKELEPPIRAHYGPENIGELYEDDKREAMIRAEKNISLFLNCHANGIEMESGAIKSVIAQDISSGQRYRFAGKWFADCTGHGSIGFLAGADFDIAIKGHMGRNNLLRPVETGEPQPFPRCPWALDLSDKPFPGRGDDPSIRGGIGIEALGTFMWESGYDRDPIKNGEYIRDWNFRALYGAWDCLKNVDNMYPNYKLAWVAYISGTRESRRLLGDVVLTGVDIIIGKKFEDGCVPADWPIDLHWPHKPYSKGFEGNAFISEGHGVKYEVPFWIPYRSLYSRNIQNLFMAGRDISTTREALGAVRVMRTTGMMGEVVGMAVADRCRSLLGGETNPAGREAGTGAEAFRRPLRSSYRPEDLPFQENLRATFPI